MVALRVTSLTMRTDIAGIIARESDVRRIIFRHICWDDPNPDPDNVQLAGQLEQECFVHLAKHDTWSNGIANNHPDDRLCGTSLTVRHLEGNLYLVDIRAEADTTHEPVVRLAEKFPQYGIVLKSAGVRIASETGYADHLDLFAQTFNEALIHVLGVGAQVTEQELAEAADYRNNLEVDLPTKAMLLGVWMEENGDTEQQELVIKLANHLAAWNNLPSSQRRLPRANEVALLPEFAKAVHRSFEQYWQ